MNCHLYLRSGTIYLPTMGKMDEGFYRAVEPVAVVSASDIDGTRKALQAAIVRGNPAVPILRRSEIPPPLLPKYAGVKSWSAFERGMKFWTIKEKNDVFQIAGQSKRADGGWRTDPERTIDFPPDSTTDDVIDRMIAIVREEAEKKSEEIVDLTKNPKACSGSPKRKFCQPLRCFGTRRRRSRRSGGSSSTPAGRSATLRGAPSVLYA
jgi:hypothetical protein